MSVRYGCLVYLSLLRLSKHCIFYDDTFVYTKGFSLPYAVQSRETGVENYSPKSRSISVTNYLS